LILSKLISADIIFCDDLLDKKIDILIDKTKLPKAQLQNIISEARMIVK